MATGTRRRVARLIAGTALFLAALVVVFALGFAAELASAWRTAPTVTQVQQ